LIHCGDFTKLGLKDEMVAFITWLKKQPFKYKIVVAGNHDISLDVEHYETNLKKRFH
jgi:3',5'-cyclic AMP phosphodiesterase CpdA